MTDPAFDWPPETRTALALEALRDRIAQRFSDVDQDAAGLPHVPLARQMLAVDYRARADVVMGVVGEAVAAAYVAGEESVRAEWRAQGGVGMEAELRPKEARCGH